MVARPAGPVVVAAAAGSGGVGRREGGGSRQWWAASHSVGFVDFGWVVWGTGLLG